MMFHRMLLPLCLLAAGLLAGEEITDYRGSQSRFRKQEGLFQKLNTAGVSIWQGDLIPVEPGKTYRGTIRFEVENYIPGMLCSVALTGYDHNRQPVTGKFESGAIHQLVTDAGTVRTVERKLEATPAIRFMRMELKLAGNPGSIRIGAHSIEPWEKPPLFRGIYTPKAKAPDRNDALAAVARVTPAEGKIERVNQRPQLMIDGKAVPGKVYKGSRDYGELARHGGNLIFTFVSGTTLFWDKRNWDPGAMRPDGTFDFSRLESELLFIHHAAPDARVLVTVNVDPGEHFFSRHPDSIFRNEAGELGVRQLNQFAGFGVPGPNPARNRHWAISYASADYENYVNDGLRQLAEFLRQSPAGNIVAGFTINGGHDDQFLQWEYGSARGQADYSPAALQEYRNYLKEKYQKIEALREAWDDPSVDFATAPMFRESEWKSRPSWHSAAPGLDRKIADGREFISLSIARLQNSFGRTLKAAFGRPCLVGTYYSSPLWRQTGRQSLSELVKDGNIDMVFQVSSYSALRRIGGLGASGNFTIAAAHLRNTLFLQEMDFRTWRSQITAGWDDHQAAEPADATEFRTQLLRDCGAVLACGGDGFFFFDMFESWYNDPEALTVIEEMYRMADWQNRYRDQVPRSQAAVFLDERATFYTEGRGGEEIQYAWKLSGLTPDLCFLDDLTNPQLPDYQLYIVPSPSTITPEQLAVLKRILETPGKVVLITGNCGTNSIGKLGSSAPALAELGLQVQDHPAPLTDTAVFCENTRIALAKNCQGRLGLVNLFLGNGDEMRVTPVPQWTSVADPEAAGFGVWQTSKLPALAVKRPFGKGTLIYCAQTDGVTPQLLANAADEAGAHRYAEPGNSVTVGCGVASAHRLTREISLRFPAAMEFFDSQSGKKIGEGREIKLDHLKPGASQVILYRIPEKGKAIVNTR